MQLNADSRWIHTQFAIVIGERNQLIDKITPPRLQPFNQSTQEEQPPPPPCAVPVLSQTQALYMSKDCGPVAK